MRTHDDYLQRQMQADPTFERNLNEARAELRLAMALTEQRESLNLTQKAVADLMRVAQSHIARYEKAGRTPRVTTLWRFCDALNVTISLGPRYSVEVRPAGETFAEQCIVTGETDASPAGIHAMIKSEPRS